MSNLKEKIYKILLDNNFKVISIEIYNDVIKYYLI